MTGSSSILPTLTAGYKRERKIPLHPEADRTVLEPKCGSCTLMLVRLAYRRALWFVLFREPLVLGMRIMACWHNVDARRYSVCRPECTACIRFIKNELKEKSPAFRLLNDWINPVFNRLRDSRVTGEEKAEARKFAEMAMKSSERPRA